VDVKDRFSAFVRTMPPAHRVGIVAALVVVLMAGVVFTRWITTPTYTVLYSGMDDAAVAQVISELDGLGVPYRLEGGSRVLVPKERLYATRATLAAAGVAGRTTPAGYELLDDQGLSISDFRQKVDYQRAVEGELAKTLMAMDGITTASVHLALPEEELFTERRKPATASVLVGTGRQLGESEVEAITFLVASSVEGLDANQITLADTRGQVLHAPGDAAGSTSVTNRHQRQTREFEQALAGDLSTLLSSVTNGTPASVIVRATLNYDENETQTETYADDNVVTLKESTSEELYEGTGAGPAVGAVGVDGGPLLEGGAGDSVYNRNEALREFGVDKVVSRTVTAPGTVERLSVAVVMDDGTLSGAAVPALAEIEALTTAALGLDEARGDSVAVTLLPLPVPEEAEVVEEEEGGIIDLLPQIVAVIVLLLVGIALFLMSRRSKASKPAKVAAVTPVAVAPTTMLEPPAEPEPDPSADLQREVAELVSKQPEEIAMLLRGWLADRRAG
jgi:flagellar M-ring protein FliF